MNKIKYPPIITISTSKGLSQAEINNALPDILKTLKEIKENKAAKIKFMINEIIPTRIESINIKTKAGIINIIKE